MMEQIYVVLMKATHIQIPMKLFILKVRLWRSKKCCLLTIIMVMRTIALRPHLIWGPGDTNLIPTIIKKAKSGDLVQVGPGNNLVDICYIEDCVEAQICAMRALQSNPNAGGKAYFISQGEPVKLWEWINEVLVANDLKPIKRAIPFWLASSLASIFELIAKILPGNKEPRLTRFLVSQMATAHYFDISAAKKRIRICAQVQCC